MIIRKNFLIKWLVTSLFFIIFSPFAFATTTLNTLNTQSVVGYWQTIDGKTQKPSSIIQILQHKQFFMGKIVKTFPLPGEQKSKLCIACSGNQKNKPILGLTIINNMVCQPGSCAHGTILDPRNGKLYHATIRLINSGQQLKVHGYVGMPLFGKTVIWQRVSQKDAQ